MQQHTDKLTNSQQTSQGQTNDNCRIIVVTINFVASATRNATATSTEPKTTRTRIIIDYYYTNLVKAQSLTDNLSSIHFCYLLREVNYYVGKL
jgi:hypothetical protein